MEFMGSHGGVALQHVSLDEVMDKGLLLFLSHPFVSDKSVTQLQYFF